MYVEYQYVDRKKKMQDCFAGTFFILRKVTK